MYLCGLGGSDYVDPPRLKAGGDCDKPEVILPDPGRVTAATKSFKGMTSIGNEDPTVTQVCARASRFCLSLPLSVSIADSKRVRMLEARGLNYYWHFWSVWSKSLCLSLAKGTNQPASGHPRVGWHTRE